MIPSYIITSEPDFLKTKYRENVKLKCTFCSNVFERPKRNVCNSIRLNVSECHCSKKCTTMSQRVLPNIRECKYCSSVFKPKARSNIYCSSSCAAKDNNRKESYKKQISCLVCNTLITVNKTCKTKVCEMCLSKKRERFNYRKKLKIIKIPSKKENLRVEWKCPVCEKILILLPSNAKKRKYCSGKCRNLVNNPKISGSRSKAEVYLENTLKEKFPNLNIKTNNREVLNGLELDFYLPELKLAIEWNGIYHIKPVHGEESLNKYKERDKVKQRLCKEKGITLVTVLDETSHEKFIRQQVEKIIEQISKSVIK